MTLSSVAALILADMLAALHAVDWFQLGSATFTAFAAMAAWATVRHATLDRRASQTPSLHIEVAYSAPSGDMYATVMNYGGPAKMARYLVLEGDPPLSQAGTWSNELEMSSEDVAIALGHQDGGNLVRRLYGHRDKGRALDRIVGAYATRATNRPKRLGSSTVASSQQTLFGDTYV